MSMLLQITFFKMQSWRLSGIFTRIAVVLLLLAVSPVRAQGVDGIVSDPIRSDQFDTAIRRLNLTYDQQIAVEREHEQYKQRFLDLRRGEIESMVKRMMEMQASMRGMPRKKDMEKILDLRNSVIQHMNNLDRDLFDAIALHLNESQLSALARIRRERVRQTYDLVFIGGQFGGSVANLLQIVEGLNMNDEEWSAVDGTLVEYETVINTALKTLHDKTISMFVKLFDVVEELGFTEPDMEDMDGMMDFATRMQEAMRKTTKDLQKAYEKISSLNKTYHNTIDSSLAPKYQKEFERRYLRETYPGIYQDWESPEMLFKAARHMNDISSSQLSELEAIERTWQSSYNSICRKMMDLEDEHNKQGFNPFGGMMGGDDTYYQDLQELEAERSELNEKTNNQITNALGKELTMRFSNYRGWDGSEEELQQSIAYMNDETDVTIEMIDEDGDYIYEEIEDDYYSGFTNRGSDHLIPGAISISEFRFYAKRLALSDTVSTIAAEYLNDYQEKYQELNDSVVIKRIIEPQQRIWNEEGGMDVDVAFEVEEGRKAAMQSILNLDNEFFDEIATLLSQDQLKNLEAVKTARLKVVYDVGGFSFSEAADPVDYTSLLAKLGLSTEELSHVLPTLEEYEQEILPILKKHHSTSLEQQRVQIEAQSKMQKLQEDPETNMDAWMEYQQMTQSVQSRIDKLLKQRAEIERGIKDEFVLVLPTDAAEKFEDQIKRLAYPDVYPDYDNAERQIRGAMELLDLADMQRGELELIHLEHMEKHTAICDNMIELIDILGGMDMDWTDFDPVKMAEMQRRRSEQEVLNYVREELNATSCRRIRAILHEEQAARVRGLGVDKPEG